MRVGKVDCRLAVVLVLGWPSVVAVAAEGAVPARGQQPNDGRVPLGDNFSPFELVTTGAVAAAGIAAVAFGHQLAGSPAPSLGPPAPGSFDRRWADRLHLDDGSGGRFLGRVPDLAGLFVLPYLPALAYGLDSLAIARGVAPWLSDDPNPDHRFVAYAEALGWTALATGITKQLVGRQRPYIVLDHPELAGARHEENLSFFSSHASAVFAAASFAALDVGRRLSAGPLRDASPGRRWLLGSGLPYAVAFGVASLVGVSRVIDQQHWPTDVLAGALVGSGITHLVYLAHFDGRGRPRRARSPEAGTAVRLIPTAQGLALIALLP